MLSLLEQRQNHKVRNMLARVPPTPEDQIILRRNFDRMLRWVTPLDARTAMRVLNRWCGDYLHNRFPE